MVNGYIGWVGLLLCVACRREQAEPLQEPPIEQGVGVWITGTQGEVMLDAHVSSGPLRAEVDLSGQTFFTDLLPGLNVVRGDLAQHATTFASPTITPDAVSAAQLTLAPVGAAAVADTTVDHVASVGEVSLEVVGGSVSVNDLPVSSYTFEALLVSGDTRSAVPGPMIGLQNDVDLVDIELHQVVYLKAFDDQDEKVELSEPAVFSIPLEPGSPVTEDGSWGWYQYSSNRGYWTRGAAVVLDGDRASGETMSLGWWALGRAAHERGCVTGQIVDSAGQGVTGAELLLIEEGLGAVDKIWSLDGSFCATLAPGATATASVLWYDPTHTTMGTWRDTIAGPSVAGACGGASCQDLGVITLDLHHDVDLDHYFDGPGGDCDDRDENVNPSTAYGDGSFCAEAW